MPDLYDSVFTFLHYNGVNIYALTDGGSGDNNSSNSGISNHDDAYPLNFNNMDWTSDIFRDGFGNDWKIEKRIDQNGEVQYRFFRDDAPKNWNEMASEMFTTLTNVYDTQSTSFSGGKGKKGEWEYAIGAFNNIDGLPQFGVMWGDGNKFGSNGYDGTSFYVGTGTFSINNPKNGQIGELVRGITVGMKF